MPSPTRSEQPASAEAESTLRVLRRRWPELARRIDAAAPPRELRAIGEGARRTFVVDGIQLTSAHDRLGEAALQAALVPGGAPEARVFGLALGDLPRALLSRDALRSLTVVVLNCGLAGRLLTSGEPFEWLDDPRVELVDGSRDVDVRAPFAAAPACLRLADEACLRLRDQVQLELATPFIRRRVQARDGEFSTQLEANRPRLSTDGGASALFATHPRARIHVAAAGPTLSRSFERLRARPAHEPLIAVDAALAPLVAAGVSPDVVTSIDSSRRGILPYFSGDLSSCADSALVYLPVVHPDVLALWPGRHLTAFSHEARYAAFVAERPADRLFVSGTVLHPSVDLAVRMGAATVELHGADLSFPGGMSHVAGAAHAHAVQSWMRRGVWVLDGHGERVPTLPNLRGYLRDLESWLAHVSGVRFVKRVRDGARIEGVEYEEHEGEPA